MCLLSWGACWYRRTDDRLLPSIAVTAMLLGAAHLFILYSGAPHDTNSMATHVAKIGAYVAMIVAVWQMASSDMHELVRAERSLAELNHELEARVLARTAELEAANQFLRVEVEARARTERVLDESRVLLQSMTDNSPSVIYAKDLEGRYLFVNPQFVELFGGTLEETIGKTDFDVAPREAAEGYVDMDRRVIASNVALAEEESVTLDGVVHTYLSVKAPLRDSSGATYGVFGVSTDITDRHRAQDALRASEARTRSIIDAALDAVVTMDARGLITGWTTQAEKVFGWPAADVVGRPLADVIIPEALRAGHRAGLARYLDTGEVKRAQPPAGASRAAPRRHGVPGGDFDHPDTPRRCAGLQCVRARHQRTAGGRTAGRGTARPPEPARSDHARDRRTAGPRQHSPGGRAQPRGPPAAGFLLRLPVRPGPASAGGDAGRGEESGHSPSSWRCPKRSTIPVDQNGLSRAVAGELVYEDGLDRSPHPFPQRLARGGLRSFVAAPLVVETSMFGVLIAARRQSPGFSSAECEFLRQLSEHVALAAHHSRAVRRPAGGVRRPASDASRRSCSRNASRRSGRWPAGSPTTSTTPSRRSCSTPRRCSRAKSTSPRRAAITSRSSSARPTTWRRRWPGCASSTASASRSCSRCRSN